VHRADNLTTFMRRLSWNLGASTSWNPHGLSRPAMGLIYLLPLQCFYVRVVHGAKQLSFYHPIIQTGPLGLNQSHSQWVSAAISWPWREAKPGPTNRSEVENGWIYTSASPYAFPACTRNTLNLFYVTEFPKLLLLPTKFLNNGGTT
jgi:hypothetical protein